MDRSNNSQSPRDTSLVPHTGPAGGSAKSEVMPESWRHLTKFVDQFSDDAVFAVLTDPKDAPKRLWIVRDIEKVRPAAVPINQAATFDLAVLGTDDEVTREVRFTIDEIESVWAAEPSGGY